MEYEDLEPRATRIVPLSQLDLSNMSLVDLEDRIAELKSEISRCEAMIESKKGSRAGAEAFFKK
jgi:uncharacterized small protein (DUF1192 family)